MKRSRKIQGREISRADERYATRKLVRTRAVGFSGLRRRTLPDDMLISIFSRCDAKTLCMCYLASKHLRELVLQIQAITIELPFVFDHMSDPVWPDGLLEFLEHFSEVQSMRIVFLCPTAYYRLRVPGSMIRWKWSEYGLIYFSGEECHRSCDFQSRDICDVVPINQVAPPYSEMLNIWPVSIMWRRYMEHIVDVFPNIREITAVDGREEGHVHFDIDHINKIRYKMPDPPVLVQVATWRAPIVQVQGIMMKNVKLEIKRKVEISHHLMAEAFCEEQEYCYIALRMMQEPDTYNYYEDFSSDLI